MTSGDRRRADRERWCSILADVSVVTVTPFDGGDSVDLAGLRRNLAHVLDGGARIVVAGGNTGEVWSLSDDELVKVTLAHAEAAAGRATVIGGVVGSPGTVSRLAPLLREAGAEALMVHQPPNPYAGDAGLAAWYEAIGAAADAPLIAYVRSASFGERSARTLETHDAWVGVKYALPEPGRFAALAHAAPSLAWVCGLAESWAPAFDVAGAIGFTSGVANVEPRRSLALHRALRSGDQMAARARWREILPFEELRARRGDANNVSVVKAALDLIGLCGGPVRPPLEDLPEADRPELEAIIRQWRQGP
jgi:4-hydroxy-tetrahydrodipicolinate synthase